MHTFFSVQFVRSCGIFRSSASQAKNVIYSNFDCNELREYSKCLSKSKKKNIHTTLNASNWNCSKQPTMTNNTLAAKRKICSQNVCLVQCQHHSDILYSLHLYMYLYHIYILHSVLMINGQPFEKCWFFCISNQYGYVPCACTEGIWTLEWDFFFVFEMRQFPYKYTVKVDERKTSAVCFRQHSTILIESKWNGFENESIDL